MRIIIDADACPKGVKNTCLDLGKRYGYEVVMVIDHAHQLTGDYTIIQVPKGADSVDFKIVSITKEDDIIITQDYGLASIILSKARAILNPNGFAYTKFNIDTLMFQRHTNAKNRKAGKRTKGQKKRSNDDDIRFKELLEKTLKAFN